MEITITVDESQLQSIATAAVRATFHQGDRWEGSGVGVTAIRKQANAWAESQDYTEAIKAVAPAIFAETIKEVLVEAIKTEAKKQVKLMRETGELGGLFKDAS
jgi:membrane carboxypeptidase/penicillin-binding protein